MAAHKQPANSLPIWREPGEVVSSVPLSSSKRIPREPPTPAAAGGWRRVSVYGCVNSGLSIPATFMEADYIYLADPETSWLKLELLGPSPPAPHQASSSSRPPSIYKGVLLSPNSPSRNSLRPAFHPRAKPSPGCPTP